jgi:hypothetical protein
VDLICRETRGKNLIRIAGQSEPAGFDKNVRQPGLAFIAANPAGTKLANYWKLARSDLHQAYAGVCAYTCFYVPGFGSVDHFLPKTTHPAYAYEWSNYRLSSAEANSYKGESTEVLDPFIVADNWFVMDFPSCLMRPAPHLSSAVATQVEKTIEVLWLNTADRFVQERCEIVLFFVDGHCTIKYLQQRYPFIAKEITRQGGRPALIPIFERRTI